MSIIDYVKNVVRIEGEAILKLSNEVEQGFEDVLQLLLNCEGKVIVSGVGKSGHIGKKIAASFASTGTPSFFLHSTEGVHGDLGMIEDKDVVILISNSGETSEVLNLFPTLEKLGVKTVAITSKENSSLALKSDAAVIYTYEREVDQLGLAPTTSSTLTLVIGDALAVTLSHLKSFTNENFHLFHPGGSLGDKLSKKEVE